MNNQRSNLIGLFLLFVIQYLIALFITIFFNSLFQTVCQQFWSTTVANQKRCAITQQLNTDVYLGILAVIAMLLYLAYWRYKLKRAKKKEDQEKNNITTIQV